MNSVCSSGVCAPHECFGSLPADSPDRQEMLKYIIECENPEAVRCIINYIYGCVRDQRSSEVYFVRIAVHMNFASTYGQMRVYITNILPNMITEGLDLLISCA